MKKQKVVRSYSPNCTKDAAELTEALKNGYQFVRASEFIPPQGNKVGYIEYIVEKDEDSPKEEKLREELEALRQKLDIVRKENEDREAYIQAVNQNADLQRKGTINGLIKLIGLENRARYDADINGSSDKLLNCLRDIKNILKNANQISDEDIMQELDGVKGGTEC